MRGMLGMLGIRVGMMEIQGIRVGMQGIGIRMRGIGGGNKGNHVENFRIGVEMMNKKCGDE